MEETIIALIILFVIGGFLYWAGRTIARFLTPPPEMEAGRELWDEFQFLADQAARQEQEEKE